VELEGSNDAYRVHSFLKNDISMYSLFRYND
jgi:hypothetical protein